MDAPLALPQSNPDTLVEIFTTIHGFPSSADFAIWLTKGQFNQQIYENKTEEGKYKRIYQYESEGHTFFQGKLEIDLSHFPAKIIQAFMDQSLLSLGNPSFNQLGKTCLSRVFVDPYYTIISHVLHKTKKAGMVWEIYNINRISEIYKTKKLALQIK